MRALGTVYSSVNVSWFFYVRDSLTETAGGRGLWHLAVLGQIHTRVHTTCVDLHSLPASLCFISLISKMVTVVPPS